MTLRPEHTVAVLSEQAREGSLSAAIALERGLRARGRGLEAALGSARK
jgi:hypothetical protein